ncbi:MAG TPA: glycogen/starch/alpha-glucan phosphorylase, partial [Dongiaceae bacterium]|nr:glycogen/starch/alpha-glucan phosphorylase [Dongiaceae bacterium]
GEQYCVLADFRSYLDVQSDVDALYPDGEEWTRRAILNVARMGGFSSDRAVLDYAREIWGTRSVRSGQQDDDRQIGQDFAQL